MEASETPRVAIIMGSKSDWGTLQPASSLLEQFEVAHECRILSAHRTPQLATEFAATADERGLEVLIAGAGGAAHLPGVMAAHTCLPVLGVPIQSKALNGIDSLLSIVHIPSGVPVGTLAIGEGGAKNAALLAISILGNSRPALRHQLQTWREEQAERVRGESLP